MKSDDFFTRGSLLRRKQERGSIKLRNDDNWFTLAGLKECGEVTSENIVFVIQSRKTSTDEDNLERYSIEILVCGQNYCHHGFLLTGSEYWKKLT